MSLKMSRTGMGGVRAPHPPEHNLIQRPELIQRLAQRFGMRQAHVTPTLTDSVQPVAVVEDLTIRDSRSMVRGWFNLWARGDGVRNPACGIRCPEGQHLRFPLLRVFVLPSLASYLRMYTATSITTLTVPFTAGISGDWRLPVGAPPVTELPTVNAGATVIAGGTVTQIGQWTAVAGVPWDYEFDGFELNGGAAAYWDNLGGTDVNDAISVHGVWEMEADS